MQNIFPTIYIQEKFENECFGGSGSDRAEFGYAVPSSDEEEDDDLNAASDASGIAAEHNPVEGDLQEMAAKKRVKMALD